MLIKFGINQKDFFEQYQSIKPLLIEQGFKHDYFNWSDVNNIYERSNIASEDFKITFGKVVAKHEYVEKFFDIGMEKHRLLKHVVYNYLKQGATLISNKITHERKVGLLAKQISTFTGRQTLSSAYLAFGSRDSFRAHWDTRDVFAIQVFGRKRWIVYRPSLKDPLHTQQSKDVEHKYPCPDEVYMDVILNPGDILYIPRGWWHNPLPLGEKTFHLSIGTYPAYPRDYLRWIYEQLPEFEVARKSLHSWQADQTTVESLAGVITDLMNDPSNYQRFMDSFLGERILESNLNLEVFGNPQVDSLPETSRIKLNNVQTYDLSEDYIIANGTKLHLDLQSGALIRYINNNPYAHVQDVYQAFDSLGESRISKLIYELCQQDILEIVEY